MTTGQDKGRNNAEKNECGGALRGTGTESGNRKEKDTTITSKRRRRKGKMSVVWEEKRKTNGLSLKDEKNTTLVLGRAMLNFVPAQQQLGHTTRLVMRISSKGDGLIVNARDEEPHSWYPKQPGNPPAGYRMG